ncbi:uncharacterized protein LOC141905743 isoform X2 [Tubulanus polymorphus]|uniref:uncharacterized protein LOC141905743 isoform X2 n=1 Tax=Tubulanus polymorphus TaxID=672921 RepID=UPI003DA3EDAF
MLSCLSQGVGGWDGSVTPFQKPGRKLHENYLENDVIHRHGVTVRYNNDQSTELYHKQDGELLLPKTNLTRKGALLLFVAPEKVPGLTETEKQFMRKRLQNMNMIELNEKIGTIQRLGQSVLQYGDWDYDMENGSISDEENRIILKFLRGLDNKCIDKKSQPGGDINQYLQDLRSRCRSTTRMSSAAGEFEDAVDLQGLVNDLHQQSLEPTNTPNSSRPGSSSSRRVLSAGKLMSRIQSANTYLGRPTSSIATVDSGYDTINQASRKTTPKPPTTSRPVSQSESSSRQHRLKSAARVRSAAKLGKTTPGGDTVLLPPSSHHPLLASSSSVLSPDPDISLTDDVMSDYSSLIEDEILDLSDGDETLQEVDSEYIHQYNNGVLDSSKSDTFSLQLNKPDGYGTVGVTGDNIVQPTLPSYTGTFSGNKTVFSLNTTTADETDINDIDECVKQGMMLPHDLHTLVQSTTDSSCYTASFATLPPHDPPPSRSSFTPAISSSSSTLLHATINNDYIHSQEIIQSSEIYSTRSSSVFSEDDFEDEKQTVASVLSDRTQDDSRPQTARTNSQQSHRHSDTRPASRYSDNRSASRISDVSKESSGGKSRRRKLSNSSSLASSVRSHKSSSSKPATTFNVLPSKSSNEMPIIKHQDVKEITPKLAFMEEKTAKPAASSETPSKSLPTSASEKKLLDKRKSEKKSLKLERLQAAAAMETSLADEIKAMTVKTEKDTKLKPPSSAPPIVHPRVQSAKRRPSKDEVEVLAKEVDEMMAATQSLSYDEGMSLEELELEKKLLQEKMSQAQDKITSTPSSAVSKKSAGKQKTERKGSKISGRKGKKSTANKEDENSLEKQREELKIQKQLEKERRLQEAMRIQSQIQEKEEERREELAALEIKKKDLEEQMDSLSAEAAEAWRMEEEAHEMFVANQIASRQQREEKRKTELERRRRETVEKRQQQRKMMESARMKEIKMLESIGSDPSERLQLLSEQREKMIAEEAEEEQKLKEMEMQAKIEAEKEEERIAELERLAEEEALARLRKERADAEKRKRILQEEAENLAQEEIVKREQLMKEQRELEEERERQEEEARRKLQDERKRIMELQKMEEAARMQVQQDMEKRRSAALKRREHNLEVRTHLDGMRQGQNVTRPWVFSYFVLWPRETYERLMGDDDNKKKRGSGSRFKSRSAPAGGKR